MNNKEYCHYISKLSIKALLYEVSVTPKPGLVDRYNSGAHRDMDFFTFIDSSLSFGDYFYKCTDAGIEFKGENYTDLLNDIRPIGIQAEIDMFEATNNINTHKGLVFSMGIISAAAGNMFKEKDSINIDMLELSKRIKRITYGITLELEDIDIKKELTYGEKLYQKFGVKGIRGEVESGFKTVLDHSLPYLRTLIKKEKHINDVLVQVLLNLMANTEDSNILGRHDLETLNYVKEKAKKALLHGGYFTTEGKLFVEDMDKYFIKRNISPGGSADLLAITLLLYMIENGDNLK